MDRVTKELKDRYTAVMDIDNKFGLLWTYISMADEDIAHSAQKLIHVKLVSR